MVRVQMGNLPGGISEQYGRLPCRSGSGAAVPQWYLMLEEGQILGGLGVIENDFHNRKDLDPNVCAVYVEEAYRRRGIAKAMLDFVCRDLRDMGIATLYLLTDHTSFYEHCGWKFLCMVQGDGEEEMSRMYVKESGAGDGTSLNEKTPEEKKNGVK